MDIELDNERLAPFNTLSSNNKIPGIYNFYILYQDTITRVMKW